MEPDSPEPMKPEGRWPGGGPGLGVLAWALLRVALGLTGPVLGLSFPAVAPLSGGTEQKRCVLLDLLPAFGGGVGHTWGAEGWSWEGGGGESRAGSLPVADSSLWCSVGQTGTHSPVPTPTSQSTRLARDTGTYWASQTCVIGKHRAGCGMAVPLSWWLPHLSLRLPSVPSLNIPSTLPQTLPQPGAPRIVVDFSVPGDLECPTHGPPSSLASSPMSLSSAHFSPCLCVP